MKTRTGKGTGARIAGRMLLVRITVSLSIVRNKKTTKELKGKGSLSHKVEFPGLGKYLVISKSINDSYYYEPDKRGTFAFRLYSKIIDVIPEHLRGLFRFIARNVKVEFRQIENPAEYLKDLKYSYKINTI